MKCKKEVKQKQIFLIAKKKIVSFRISDFLDFFFYIQ